MYRYHASYGPGVFSSVQEEWHKQMYATDNDILEIVDEHDTVIGTGTRKDVHQEGLMHRAVHVFVFNPRGEIYVQRRAATKDKHPVKLDSSAAGHVDPGETYEQTAVRELGEELGLQEDLREILRIKACEETDNEHVALFSVTSAQEPHPNPEEIQWGGFMSRERLTRLMEEQPEDFVPAFALLWRAFVRKES